MTWFPKPCSQRDMVGATEHVTQFKVRRGTKESETMWGTYKGVCGGANGGTRTLTSKTLRPEPSASTNSATFALSIK